VSSLKEFDGVSGVPRTHRTQGFTGRRTVLTVMAAAALALAVAAPSGQAFAGQPGGGGSGHADNRPILKQKEIAAFAPDECNKQVGVNRPIRANGTCPRGYDPKFNETYLWGYTQDDRFAYFGTEANTICNATGYYGPLNPYKTRSVVCEGPESAYASRYGGTTFGDNRPPRILRFDSRTERLTDVTPPDTPDRPYDPNILGSGPGVGTCSGIRGGATFNDVSLMFGQHVDTDPNSPTFGQVTALCEAAYETSTGRLLGTHFNTTQSLIRTGAVLNGALYLAARGVPTQELPAGKGGAVLRWTGNKQNPFQYEQVGKLANEAGYINTFRNRLVVSGWNAVIGGEGALTAGPASIWMSPPVPPTGLTTGDADSWTSIFSYDQYDPDPLRGVSGFWGALTEFQGKLYVGTYTYPSLLAATFFHTYYPTLFANVGYTSRKDLNKVPDPVKLRDAYNMDSGSKLFAISNPGAADQRVRLVTGDEKLPVYDPAANSWSLKENLLHQKPSSGLGNGFNEKFNDYSWTWTVFKGRLYMGTADLCMPGYAAFPGVGNEIFQLSPPFENAVIGALNKISPRCQGGDLWRLDDERHVVAEDIHGYGNQWSGGIRSIVTFGDSFYGGAATGFNLEAGWRLVKFTPQNRPVGPRIDPNSQFNPPPIVQLPQTSTPGQIISNNVAVGVPNGA
jgi:hypothetical protein